MLIPFGAIAVGLALSTSKASVLVVVFGGVGVVGLLLVVRHLWLGGIEVRWDRASVASGRRAVFHVATTDGSSRLLSARFLLRFVGPDPWRSLRSSSPSGPRVVSLWQSECVADDRMIPGPGEFVRVEFDVPASAGAIGSSDAVEFGWEFLVHGRSTWGTLTEVFDVPMSAAPATSRLPALPATA